MSSMVEFRVFKVQRSTAAAVFCFFFTNCVTKYQKCFIVLTFVGRKLLLLPFTNNISTGKARDIRVLLGQLNMSLEICEYCQEIK